MRARSLRRIFASKVFVNLVLKLRVFKTVTRMCSTRKIWKMLSVYFKAKIESFYQSLFSIKSFSLGEGEKNQVQVQLGNSSR